MNLVKRFLENLLLELKKRDTSTICSLSNSNCDDKTTLPENLTETVYGTKDTCSCFSATTSSEGSSPDDGITSVDIYGSVQGSPNSESYEMIKNYGCGNCDDGEPVITIYGDVDSTRLEAIEGSKIIVKGSVSNSYLKGDGEGGKVKVEGSITCTQVGKYVYNSNGTMIKSGFYNSDGEKGQKSC